MTKLPFISTAEILCHHFGSNCSLFHQPWSDSSHCAENLTPTVSPAWERRREALSLHRLPLQGTLVRANLNHAWGVTGITGSVLSFRPADRSLLHYKERFTPSLNAALERIIQLICRACWLNWRLRRNWSRRVRLKATLCFSLLCLIMGRSENHFVETLWHQVSYRLLQNNVGPSVKNQNNTTT